MYNLSQKISFASVLICVLLCTPAYLQAAKTDQELIQSIYDKLKQALGDTSEALPTIKIQDMRSIDVKKVGAFDYHSNTIYIESDAIRACKQLGHQMNDALAFLIGHELAHFYQKHEWEEACFVPSKERSQQKIELEREADLYGAFLAYLADFQAIEAIPVCLETIYQVYKLEDITISAPPLKERQNTAYEIQSKIRELVDVFEAALYFHASNNFAEAVMLNTYLLEFIKLNEIYNNTGVNALLEAQTIQDYNTANFAYPLSVSVDLDIRRLPMFYDRQEAIKLAKANLYKARLRNPENISILINLSCALVMNGEYAEAKPLLEAILSNKSASSKECAKAKILQAIIEAHKKKNMEAYQMLDAALNYYSGADIQELVLTNRYILKNNSSEYMPPQVGFPEDQIENIHLPSVILNEKLSGTLKKYPGISPDASFQLSILTLSKSSLIVLDEKTRLLKIHYTKSKNVLTKRGISVGKSVDDIRAVYSDMASTIRTHSLGYFLVFPKINLIFNIDRNNTIRSWAVFYTSG